MSKLFKCCYFLLGEDVAFLSITLKWNQWSYIWMHACTAWWVLSDNLLTSVAMGHNSSSLKDAFMSSQEFGVELHTNCLNTSLASLELEPRWNPKWSLMFGIIGPAEHFDDGMCIFFFGKMMVCVFADCEKRKRFSFHIWLWKLNSMKESKFKL